MRNPTLLLVISCLLVRLATTPGLAAESNAIQPSVPEDHERKIQNALNRFHAAPSAELKREAFHRYRNIGGIFSQSQLEARSAWTQYAGQTRIIKLPWLKGLERDSLFVVLPERYSPLHAYPSVVVLHGGPGGSSRNMLIMMEKHIRASGMIGLIPQTSDTKSFWSAPYQEANLLRILFWAHQQFRLDTRNINLTGYSMGGAGTWSLCEHYPDLFARAACFAGIPAGRPAGWDVFKNVSFRVIHSVQDEKAPVQLMRKAIRQLQERKIPVTYVEIEGDHQAPQRDIPATFAWFTRQNGRSTPARTRLEATDKLRTAWAKADLAAEILSNPPARTPKDKMQLAEKFLDEALDIDPGNLIAKRFREAMALK